MFACVCACFSVCVPAFVCLSYRWLSYLPDCLNAHLSSFMSTCQLCPMARLLSFLFSRHNTCLTGARLLLLPPLLAFPANPTHDSRYGLPECVCSQVPICVIACASITVETCTPVYVVVWVATFWSSPSFPSLLVQRREGKSGWGETRRSKRERWTDGGKEGERAGERARLPVRVQWHVTCWSDVWLPQSRCRPRPSL